VKALTFLRYPGYGQVSVEKIIQEMRYISPDIEVISTSDRRKIISGSILVRWGNAREVNKEKILQEINTRRAILLASNKLKARRASGVKIPKSFRLNEEPPEDFRFPGIVRPPRHTQGRDIFIVRSVQELQKFPCNYYCAEFIQKEREFRVFIAGNRCFSIAEKFPEDYDSPAWNHAAGSRFRNVSSNDSVWGPLEEIGITVARNLNLDFCGCDVIFYRGEYFFLEANTAFSLASASRTISMAGYFLKLMEENND